MNVSLTECIVQDTKENMARKLEFDEMFQNFISNDLNASTREVVKMFIVLMLETPFRYSHEIKQTVAKLEELGIKDDIEWIKKNVQQHYR
ncbi:hypothetical protein HQ403_02420 [Candidatus Kaiserbacteria bacterium]|nr:hypothetical protein [Candidatus Kaiserbacteria bacterium]